MRQIISRKPRPYRPRQSALNAQWLSPGLDIYQGGPKMLKELPATSECRFIPNLGWRDTRGKPISLHHVPTLDKYDEDWCDREIEAARRSGRRSK